MYQLAQQATNNGDATSLTYGNRPNYYATWDFDKVFGCKCDGGYTGYDCSERSCPTGDDPMTRDRTQVHDTQVFSCVGTSGTFTFTFRQVRDFVGLRSNPAILLGLCARGLYCVVFGR